jgi:DNA-binding transcriptional MerR regulator
VETFTSKEAVLFAGCTYRELDYWARTGVLEPSIPANGSGSRRLYSTDDVRALRLITTLRRAGMRLSTAGRLAEYLTDEDRPGTILLDTDGRVVPPGAPVPAVTMRLDLAALAGEPVLVLPAGPGPHLDDVTTEPGFA